MNYRWRRRIHTVRRHLRWMTHPVTIFVALQFVWIAITLIWVLWFVGQQAEIAQLAERFGRENFDSRAVIAILIVGCVLLAVLLVGTIALFVFGQKQSSLAFQQRSFVSSVTHELKSPLASLQLASETIQTRELDIQTRSRLFGMINSDIERLRRLIDRILVAGRLDQGIFGAEPVEERLHLRSTIGNIIQQAEHLDSQLSKRVSIKCGTDLEYLGPEAALQLILGNLLENAIKYSPLSAPIAIIVTLRSEYLQVQIVDQGMGLDRKEQKNIFKMFHRADISIKKAIPGTGLGLYIVKAAVRNLNGSVWVESPGRGHGSTFSIRLPNPTPSKKG